VKSYNCPVGRGDVDGAGRRAVSARPETSVM
jgi:hypothetical protein